MTQQYNRLIKRTFNKNKMYLQKLDTKTILIYVKVETTLVKPTITVFHLDSDDGLTDTSTR